LAARATGDRPHIAAAAIIAIFSLRRLSMFRSLYFFLSYAA
jgi:hypothetical protein